MQITNPQLHLGQKVRIRPHDGNRHFGRGKLLRIEGKYGIVRPLQRRKQDEKISLSDLYTWLAGNAGSGAEEESGRMATSPRKEASL